MRTKKIKTICLTLIFLLLFSFNISGVEAGDEPAGVGWPEVQGKAAVLIDEGSGRILYAKNAHRRLSPASLTKIMTALLVVENGELGKKVCVSKHAEETGESSIWLEEGEVLSRMDLLYALMLVSANDAAVALAESVAGDERAFVSMMNSRARALKLRNTHFANPHGLEMQDHYTSAFDLAVITREGMSKPLFQKIVATREMYLPWPGNPWQRALFNKNRLLYRYEGALGVKTGYTREAGNCLVGAAQRGNLRLIAVVLNSPQVYDDMEKLLDYGFCNYQGVVLQKAKRNLQVKVRRGEERFVYVEPARDLIVAVCPDERKQVTFKAKVPSDVEAPVRKGAVLGTGKIFLQGEEIGEVNLLAQESVPVKPTLWQVVSGWLRSCCQRIFG